MSPSKQPGDGEAVGRSDHFETILLRAKGGDPDALTALYNTNVAMVRGYLSVFRPVDLEDLVKEIFVTATRDLGDFDGSEPDFHRWVMGITYANRHRWSDRGRRTNTDAPKSDLEAAIAHAEHSGLGPQLLRATERLTSAQREVLALRFVADLPIDDVAEILDRSPQVIRQLQDRGLRSLRRLVADPSATTRGEGGSGDLPEQ